eukprot:GHVP01047599.1.p1 GENE.GHVP01047599.1~~GHVP01047599.1.p1  ORF type:complete len:121 (+),score=7.81 GHVP01047599.1:654-1016(+)
MSGKIIKTHAARNKLHLPIYELEWLSVWKGLTKLFQHIKKFKVLNLEILSDNSTVVNAFLNRKSTMSPTSIYYRDRIEQFLAKEDIKFNVLYIKSSENKADSYSRTLLRQPKSLWIQQCE